MLLVHQCCKSRVLVVYSEYEPITTTSSNTDKTNTVYFILILWSLSLNPSISLRTPDSADRMTTLTVV